MKLLILGGTIFLGHHLVEAASSRGHQLTLFNRGIHQAQVYPEVEYLRGDRRSDLHALENRQWDAAIDTNGYAPSQVRASATLLAQAVQSYVFISSISVYADQSIIGLNEHSPVSQLTAEQLQLVEAIVPPIQGTIALAYGQEYGAAKALCEEAAEASMPGRVLIARPGLVVGPYDYSDRFTYWPARVAHGGEVLAPGKPEQRVQFIDVRDLADWIIGQVERSQVGTYNVTGPEQPSAMLQILNECKAVSGSDATFTWVDEAFLLAEHVEPWSQMPLWLPDDPSIAGFAAVDITRALATGLTFRSLEVTVRDTLTWDRTRPHTLERQAGITREQESTLLHKWHNHR